MGRPILARVNGQGTIAPGNVPALRDARDALLVLGGAALAACTGFVVVASVALVGVNLWLPDLPQRVPDGGLWLRAALALPFLVAGLALSGWAAQRWRATTEDARALPAPPGLTPGTATLLVLALLPGVFLTTYRLDHWPTPGPDESHHLNVSHTIFQRGFYATQAAERSPYYSPSAGMDIRVEGAEQAPGDARFFKWFDSFDSVGPTVLLPIAGLWRAQDGHSFGSGRLVLAAYYLALSALTAWLLARLYGWSTGALAALLLVGAMGSIYLGRTLYGEVPAWAFVTAGLCVWRMSYAGRIWLVSLAGLLLGLAVLTKTFLILLAFPFAAAWWVDHCTHRRVPFFTLPLLGFGVFLPLAVWAVVPAFWGPGGDGGLAETIALYYHFLLFGVEGLPQPLAHVAAHPGAHTVMAVAMLGSGVLLMQRWRDPALIALWLGGVFLVFWWLFFTPGQLPRYLWYSYAVNAVMLALVVSFLLRVAWQMPHATQRAGLATTAVLLLLPGAWWVVDQGHLVLTSDEARAFAEHVERLQ